MCNVLHIGKLGANAILGVSLAICKAGAAKKVCIIHVSSAVVIISFAALIMRKCLLLCNNFY